MNGRIKKWFHQMLLGVMVATVLPAVQAQTVEYIHTDALGSVVAVTDQNKQVLERREYEPFGDQISPSARKDGPNYTGHVLDTDTGLVYAQQRYYDPLLGRFLSTDPIAADTGAGANFNRYWYANNSPYRFTDPDGRSGFDFFANGIEPVIQSYATYQGYKNGGIPGDRAARILRDYGQLGSGYLEEIRADLRKDTKALDAARARGVARAWADERRLVQETGRGTRDWTRAQIKELVDSGKVKGFVGHHINNVNLAPELADVPENIRFLTRPEHFEAHNFNWRNQTTGDLMERSPSKIARLLRYTGKIVKKLDLEE